VEDILKQILQELKELKEGQVRLEGDVSELKQGQAKLESDLATVKKDIRSIKADVKGLWEDVLRLDNRTEETRKMIGG
jgi:chromosome segregation ATPase